MGYSTIFNGELKFKNELTARQLASISYMINDDNSDCYIDLKISSDFTGLEWDGSEKTYGMVESVNMIISQMNDLYPLVDFGLTGSFLTQGGEVGDCWSLVMDEGIAKKVESLKPDDLINCPHCGKGFTLND